MKTKNNILDSYLTGTIYQIDNTIYEIFENSSFGFSIYSNDKQGDHGRYIEVNGSWGQYSKRKMFPNYLSAKKAFINKLKQEGIIT